MRIVTASTSLPPPESIRKTAAEVVSRPYYDLDLAPRDDGPPIWLELLRWITKPFKWLFESMEGLPDIVRWIVVVLAVILLVALISHLTYTFVRAIRGPLPRRRAFLATSAPETNPVDLEQEADEAGKAGDYIRAIRLLFRAALRRIETAEKKKLRPGFTNRELLRRYRSTPLFASLERFVETIDQKWYGDGTCLEEDYLTCCGEHARIRDYVQEPRTAVGA
jgi:hypothetical protein